MRSVATNYYSLNLTDTISLNAGEYIDVRGRNDSSVALNASAASVKVAIERIGN